MDKEKATNQETLKRRLFEMLSSSVGLRIESWWAHLAMVAIPASQYPWSPPGVNMKWTPRRMKFVLNVYPPYAFTGIRVTRVDPQWRELHVSMKLRWYNINAVGSHFGGSLYSMVDPHLMLLLKQLLGPDYVVWDKTAGIDFRKPGRGCVHCLVQISDEQLEDIRRNTRDGAAYRPQYELEIKDDKGDIIATVTKVLHIRKSKVAPASVSGAP